MKDKVCVIPKGELHVRTCSDCGNDDVGWG